MNTVNECKKVRENLTQPVDAAAIAALLRERRIAFSPEHQAGLLKAVEKSNRQRRKSSHGQEWTAHNLRIVIRQTANYVYARKVDEALNWLHTGNPVARAVFTGLTDIELPKGAKATRTAIERFFKRELRLIRWQNYQHNRALMKSA